LNDFVETNVKGDFKVKEEEFDVDYEQKKKSPWNHSPIFKRWNRATYCWDHKSNNNAIDYEKYVWTNTRVKHFCFRTRLATFQSKEGDSMINFFKWLNDITSQLVNIEKIVVEKDSGKYIYFYIF